MGDEPEMASFQDIYEENEGEGYGEGSEFYEDHEEGTRRRKKRKPSFKPRGLDYTLKEDRQKHFMGLEKDMLTAKAYLKKQEETPHKIILYDHLNSVIDKLVTRKPPNAGEIFEEYCRILRKSKYYPATDHLQDMYVPPQFTESEKVIRLLKSIQHLPVTREYLEDNDVRDINLIESLNYFEQIGIGFSQLETFSIRIKLMNLAREKRFKTYRFWGKIFGIYNDYIIAETEQFPADIQLMLEEQEMEERRKREEEDRIIREQQDILMKVLNAAIDKAEEAAAVKKKEDEAAAAEAKGEEDEEEGAQVEEEEEEQEPPPRSPPEFPPMPESTFQKPPEVPPEKRGEGPNRKVYYICSRLDDEWIQLPDVTPQQIQIARKIRKLFTGDLEAEVNTYPQFPGKEINLLRAQIARISATTQVSPKGYFKIEGVGGEEELEEEEEELVGEDEEEGGGGAQKGPVIENPSYRPKPLKQLIQLKNWVHHQQAILEQGRCKFWAAEKERGGEDEEEEEEMEEEEEGVGGSKEKAPPLFRPLTKDTCPLVKTLWSIQASSTLTPETAFAFLRSEIWPGYYAFCSGSKYDGIYIGWGLKYSPFNYSVPGVPVIQAEYIIGPEIMEISDPTWEQEEKWRIAHEPKIRLSKMLGEGEGEEDESEEESEEGGGGGDDASGDSDDDD